MGKEKFDAKSFKKILLYAKPYFFIIIIAMIFAVGGAITTIIGPDKIMDLVGLISDGIFAASIDMTGFMKVVISLICIYGVGAIANYAQQYLMAIVTQKTSKRLRTDIDKKINKLPLAYFDNTTKGDILSRVTNDVDTISQTLGSSIANLVSSIVLFIGVIIAMFSKNWLLSLVTIGSSIFGFILMSVILVFSQKYFVKRQVYLGDMNGQIEEIYTNYSTVKSYNAAKLEKAKFKKHNENIYGVTWKAQFMSGLMMPIMTFVGNLGYVLIFVVGVSIILNGGKEVGIDTLMGFIIYARLFSQPLSNFAQSMTSIQQASAASRRVFEILEQKELSDESEKTEKLENVIGNVEFKNVHFGYLEDKVIIHDFSAKCKAGQKIAIVGPTGAGKTTIVNLLMRFYEMNSGDIVIDGKSIKDLTRENVHDLFDMILQDTWLFNGTVRDNLVYNKTGVSDKKLDEVCKAVGLSHFIRTLPNGYDTFLSDVNSLSEGQRQQLTIARAMIKDSPLLILDEATSNVDTRTELIIQNAMDELTKGRTSFVIAHRLSTIRNADMILVLKDGDIVEQGNHEKLLAKNGFYAELYNSQFVNIG
ncbi:MAG: ABC transporter ATP-binding protein [Erysipelotrichales bacterium]|nr:ABC transporter ATP-binding protein [Erysipelotrichales bacterium]